MPPTPVDRSSVRSAAAINEEIRALWVGDVRVPADEERYRELLVEWAAAVRAEGLRGDVSEAA